MSHYQRRKFIQSIGLLSAATGLGLTAKASGITNSPVLKTNQNRFKISLNAYSFNEPLKNGKTNLEAVMEFCARENFDAIDLTGYYFPGYPEVPSDEYIFKLKRKAHQLGLSISGTGIRNEFAEPDPIKRAGEIEFVKNWINVAAKLGAPVIRIFTGKTIPEHYTWETTEAWIIEAIKACVEHGKKMGVIVSVQNHNDFIKTSEQMIDIIQKVNSEWFGLIMDSGSFVTHEPYSEIAKTANYAVNWQIKEKLNYNGRIDNMDLEKLFRIIVASDYRGFLPIETLSPGDPFSIVPPFLQQVRTALNKVLESAT